LPGGQAAVVDHAQHVVHHPVGHAFGVAAVGQHGLFKVIRQATLTGKDVGVVFRQGILPGKPQSPLERQLGHQRQDGLFPGFIQHGRQQIRLAEITVIRLGFLRTHFLQLAGVLVPFQRPGFDAVAGFHFADLAQDLGFDCFTHRVDRVDVLDFRLGIQVGSAHRANGNIGVAAQVRLFHIRLGNAEPAQELAQADEILRRLVGAAQVRVGHHFDQRHATAVEVDQAAAVLGFGFSGVFLHMQLGDPHPAHVRAAIRPAGWHGYVHIPAFAHRQVVL